MSRRTVGIVGLGLIGGSFAKAYARAGWRVLAADADAETLELASVEVVDGVLDASSAASCDLVVLAAYPAACVEWLRRNGAGLRSTPEAGTVVIDTAGVKRGVCSACFGLAREHGFVFVGSHPMAGSQFSGFAHSRADLFDGAPMVLVPPELDDIGRLDLLDRLVDMLAPLGFGSFSVQTAEEHDRVIAFTSQLAHVVSNAYVKSPTASRHHGVSAGSYRDLTRVAHLNAPMWAELIMENAENMERELDFVIGSLERYRDAIAEGDGAQLERLLAEGDRVKRALDGDEPYRGERR